MHLSTSEHFACLQAYEYLPEIFQVSTKIGTVSSNMKIRSVIDKAMHHELGGLEVVVEADIPDEFEISTQKNNYVAKLTDRSSFSSSVSTMNRLGRNMVQFVDLNVRQAVKLATYNPAKIHGLEDKIGILAENKKADIAVFNSNIEIKMTIVDGKISYESL